jgi:hypothetical protein
MFHTRIRRGSLAALLAALAVTVTADSGANHQVSTDLFGTSGGNVNDVSVAFCCSGTLGSLVSDGSSLYILSNNHVLGRSDQAADGEDISQPGLIDNGCAPGAIVADFTTAPALGSNVDAAIAELRPGTMSATGEIMDVGVPSATVATATVGLGVAKSGRTTGFTTGTIGSVNTNVRIQYQRSCNSGRKFFVTYTNQIVVNSSSFSAGGDSGSLIVTSDSSHQPVGLLYAGSSSTTIANPIGEVLTKVSQTLGRSVSFNLSGGGGGETGGGGGGGGGRGGGPGGTPGRSQQNISALSASELARGNRAKENHAAQLMADPAVFGVGVGEDPAAPGQAAVIVYADRGRARAAIARELDGVRTVVVDTDPIVAFGWNQPLGGGGCSAK